jgi:hypothetical protein
MTHSLKLTLILLIGGLLLIFTLIMLYIAYRKDGSPGKWTDEQTKNFKAFFFSDMTNNPDALCNKSQSSKDCFINLVSEKYSYDESNSITKKIKTNKDDTWFTKINMKHDFYYCIRPCLIQIFPPKCSDCILKGIDELMKNKDENDIKTLVSFSVFLASAITASSVQKCNC